MADNKKKKVDLSTALQAESAKLANSGGEGEKVMVMVNGVKTPIYRGTGSRRSSDAEWSAIVKKSIVDTKSDNTPDEWKGMPPTVVKPDSVTYDPASKLSEEDGNGQPTPKKKVEIAEILQLAKDPKQVRGLVSPEEEKNLANASPEARAEFIRLRMKNKGYDVPDVPLYSDKNKENNKTVDVKKPSEPMGMSIDPRNPSSVVKDMALGAAGDPKKSGAENAADDQFIKEQQGAKMVVPQELKQVGAAISGVDDSLSPMGLAGRFDKAITGALKPLNDSFTGQDWLRDADQDRIEAEARRDPGVEYDPKTAVDLLPQGGNVPVTPAPPPVAPPVQEDPQAAAMRLAMSAPGGFSPVEVDPNLKAASAAAREQSRLDAQSAQFTIAAEGEKSRQRLDEFTKTEMKTREQADKLGILAAQSQIDAAEEAKKFSSARADAAQRARDAAMDPIDPNRYWNNKNDGQKAMAIVAGALYGFTGQGMQWLQRIDGLVENDNKLQASDRASKVAGLERYASEMGVQADEATKYGLTMSQAQLLKRTQKLEGLKSQLEVLTMQQQDGQRQAQGAMMIQQLDANIAQAAEQAQQLGLQEAQMKSMNRYQNAQLAQQKFKLGIEAAGSGANGTQPIRGPQAESIGELLASIESSRSMSDNFKKSASGLVSKMTALDPTGTTGASDYNARRDVAVQLIGRALEGGKLAEGDIGRYQKMVPVAGDLRGAEKWDQLTKELQRALDKKVSALKSTGFQMGDLQRQVDAVGGSNRSTEREVE